jgi:hypothetical protein
MKHAPGLWKAEIYSLARDSRYVRRFRIEAPNALVLDGKVGVGGDVGIPQEMFDANLRLIQAAPELLSACKLALTCDDTDYSLAEWAQMRKALRKAIAVAEG